MATRGAILRELKLAPAWRLKSFHAAAARGAAAAAGPSRAAVLEPPGVAYVVEDPDGRRARIAALEWADFDADVEACRACVLCKSRRRSVPGVGDPHADWMFVGEGPGQEEDQTGEPFVGQAGRLLDSMLASLGMGREKQVYIANVVKCRPPNNRTPEPSEAEACRPYLERQVALLRPAIIVALGKSAASLLLGTDATIASLRGRQHDYGGIPLIVTYHPAYLLRSLPEKAKAWEDLLFARRVASTAAAGGAST